MSETQLSVAYLGQLKGSHSKWSIRLKKTWANPHLLPLLRLPKPFAARLRNSPWSSSHLKKYKKIESHFKFLVQKSLSRVSEFFQRQPKTPEYTSLLRAIVRHSEKIVNRVTSPSLL